jgi:anti-anti-sigma factor
MQSIERKTEKYAVVFNINLIRATLNEAREFKDSLEESIRETDKDIIVNLSSCEHLDSTFVGVMVSSFKRLKKQSRNMVIIEPLNQSSIFLTLNSIGKIFPLYQSVKSALEDIENRKILESQITELEEDRTTVDKSSPTNQTKISFEQITEFEEISMPEDISDQFELQTEMPEDKKEELQVKPFDEKNITSEKENVLIENNFKNNGKDDTPVPDPEERLKARTTSFRFESKKEKPANTKVPHPKTDIEQESSSKGPVEWNFGFS